jgi:hypothetical protein
MLKNFQNRSCFMISFQVKIGYIEIFSIRRDFLHVRRSHLVLDHYRPVSLGDAVFGNPPPAQAIPRKGAENMKVVWHLPEGAVYESRYSDVEQLLFLLRMVSSVQVKETAYAIGETVLAVGGEDELSLSVRLKTKGLPHEEVRPN